MNNKVLTGIYHLCLLLHMHMQLDIPDMLITLQGMLLAFEHGRQQDEAYSFIQSNQFKVGPLLTVSKSSNT